MYEEDENSVESFNSLLFPENFFVVFSSLSSQQFIICRYDSLSLLCAFHILKSISSRELGIGFILEGYSEGADNSAESGGKRSRKGMKNIISMFCIVDRIGGKSIVRRLLNSLRTTTRKRRGKWKIVETFLCKAFFLSAIQIHSCRSLCRRVSEKRLEQGGEIYCVIYMISTRAIRSCCSSAWNILFIANESNLLKRRVSDFTR